MIAKQKIYLHSKCYPRVPIATKYSFLFCWSYIRLFFEIYFRNILQILYIYTYLRKIATKVRSQRMTQIMSFNKCSAGGKNTLHAFCIDKNLRHRVTFSHAIRTSKVKLLCANKLGSKSIGLSITMEGARKICSLFSGARSRRQWLQQVDWWPSLSESSR